MAPGSTQPLTEIIIRNFHGGKKLLTRRADSADSHSHFGIEVILKQYVVSTTEYAGC
jgi:hypothetical protein